MAKQYRALSNIEHGEEVEGGNEITRFPYGSIVEGLDKDTMKNLWDAGVLEEVESAPPAVTKTVTQSKPSGDSGTQGNGNSNTGSSPAAPTSTGGAASDPSKTGTA